MSRRDRGAADALGLVVLAPFVIGLALVVVWVGRSVDVDAQLRTAAEAAAQAAALERNHAAGAAAARRVVAAMLTERAECSSVRTIVPERSDVGMRSGVIEVTVVCVIDTGVVPTRDVERSATAWATVDRFRSEAP